MLQNYAQLVASLTTSVSIEGKVKYYVTPFHNLISFSQFRCQENEIRREYVCKDEYDEYEIFSLGLNGFFFCFF